MVYVSSFVIKKLLANGMVLMIFEDGDDGKKMRCHSDKI